VEDLKFGNMNRYTASQERNNKKEVRNFLFSLFKDMHLKKIVGLAGPDIQDYINFCKSKGYSEFEIYEIDKLTAMHQLVNMKTTGALHLKLTDIINASPDEKETLYDLDYCGTVKTLIEHIKKFNNRFIMTFSLRGISAKETIKQFFKARKETIKSVITKMHPFKHDVYKTNSGSEYIYVSYKDGSPMCCIVKL
jgi:hypothetical protein